MAANWQVTSQVPREEFMASGRFEDGWDVFYETIPEGVQGKIWVSKRNYNEEFVRTKIDAEVATLKAVQNL